MNKRMWAVAALLTVAAMVGVVAVWPRHVAHVAVNQSTPATQGMANGIELSLAPPPPPLRATELEAAGKIAPGSYQPLGTKAYQLFRGYEIRPPGDARAHVQQLAARSARGEADATYQIYLTVDECRTFISDRVDQLIDTARSLGAGGAFLQKSERLLQECESLVLDRDLFRRDWLRRAAAQGSQEAMVLYATSPEEALGTLQDAIKDPEQVLAWKQTATAYLKDLASQGNVAALSALSTAYEFGRIVDADPMAAYAYERALQRVNPDFVSAETLKALEEQLPAGGLARANALSDTVYENCCIK